MIKIKYLSQFSDQIPALAKIWVETIGKEFHPNISLEDMQNKLKTRLNEESLPLTYIALDDDKAVGMCTLRDGEGSELFPWLGGLCVTESHRKRGIGKLLINVVKTKAYKMGFRKLYLRTLDPKLVDWYGQIGWEEMKESEEIDGKKVIFMVTNLRG